MADIELVIRLPEEVYKSIQDNDYCGISNADMYNEVKNGTPLPKGHGRLIDYSWVVDNVIKKLGIKNKRYLLEAEKALMSIIETAPTIIEAESEEQ